LKYFSPPWDPSSPSPLPFVEAAELKTSFRTCSNGFLCPVTAGRVSVVPVPIPFPSALELRDKSLGRFVGGPSSLRVLVSVLVIESAEESGVCAGDFLIEGGLKGLKTIASELW
jgi:hypothetical protein